MMNLEHHCAICKTALGSENGKRCFGKHVEWCRRFHVPFRKGWASGCQPCQHMDEQHEARHREIAELLFQLGTQRKRRGEGAEEETNVKGKRKNSWSPPDHSSSLSSINTTKKSQKAAKKIAKAINREKTFVTISDILRVEHVIHPPVLDEQGNPITAEADSPMHPEDAITAALAAADLDLAAETQRILADFGFRNRGNSRNRCEDGQLVASLAEAVRDDLVKHQEETAGIAKEAEGFLGWVPKKALVGCKRDVKGGRIGGEVEEEAKGGEWLEGNGEENWEGDGGGGEAEWGNGNFW